MTFSISDITTTNIANNNAMFAWHFTKVDRQLSHHDKRLVAPGEKLTHEGELVLCEFGLHASKRLIDALQYSPGPYVWRVEVSGDILHGNDKLVASERTALWGFDASNLLRRFARSCALDVVHLWDAPEMVIRYLKTGDDTLRAAAWDVSWDASRAVARDAAWDASWDAASAAARDAAWDAASAAAWAASSAASWDAAKAAARAAANNASWAASRARQNRRLTSMVMAEKRKIGKST